MLLVASTSSGIVGRTYPGTSIRFSLRARSSYLMHLKIHSYTNIQYIHNTSTTHRGKVCTGESFTATIIMSLLAAIAHWVT